jgi:hypothetical protein
MDGGREWGFNEGEREERSIAQVHSSSSLTGYFLCSPAYYVIEPDTFRGGSNNSVKAEKNSIKEVVGLDVMSCE